MFYSATVDSLTGTLSNVVNVSTGTWENLHSKETIFKWNGKQICYGSEWSVQGHLHMRNCNILGGMSLIPTCLTQA